MLLTMILRKKTNEGNVSSTLWFMYNITYDFHKIVSPTTINIQQDKKVIGGHVLHKELS